MTNQLISLVLIFAFIFNLFTPGIQLAAQELVGKPELNLTNFPEELLYDKKRDLDLVYTDKSGLAIKEWDSKTKRFIANKEVGQAQLRLFLNNAPHDVFIYFLSTQVIPAGTSEFYTSNTFPMLWVHSMPTENYKTALKRLNLMQEKNLLYMDDYVSLLASPSDEIASFGATMLSELVDYAATEKATDYLKALHTTYPHLPALLQKRLGKLAGHDERERNTLFAAIHLLLARVHASYKTTKETSPLTAPAINRLAKEMMTQLAESPTNKEKLHDFAFQHRQTLAESTTNALLIYYGPEGFARVMNFLESKNTDLFGRKQYKMESTFGSLQSASFNAFITQYVNRLSGKGRPVSSEERQQLKKLLFQYAAPGNSTNLRLLALGTLSMFYVPAQNKTLAVLQPASAPFASLLTEQEANWVADALKKDFYCPADGINGNKGRFGLNADKMAAFQDGVAAYYNQIRQDPQEWVTQIAANGKATPIPCYVKPSNTANPALRSAEQTTDAVFFFAWWVPFDLVFAGANAALRFGGQAKNLTKAALKMPVGQRQIFIKNSLQVTKRNATLSKGLDDVGVSMSKVVSTKYGHQVKPLVEKGIYPYRPKEEIVQIAVRQRYPSGDLRVTTIDGASISRTAAANAVVKKGHTGARGLKDLDDVMYHYVEKVAPANKQAYREAIAAQDVLHTGLEKLAPSLPRIPAQKATGGNFGLTNEIYDTSSLFDGSLLTAALREPAELGISLYIKRPAYVTLGFGVFGPFGQARENQNKAREQAATQARFNEQLKEQEEDKQLEMNQLLQQTGYATVDMTPLATQTTQAQAPVSQEKSYTSYVEQLAKETPIAWLDGLFTWAIGGITQAAQGVVSGKYIPTKTASAAERRKILEQNPYLKIYTEQLRAKQEREFVKMQTNPETLPSYQSATPDTLWAEDQLTPEEQAYLDSLDN